MKKFDMNDFLANPRQALVCEYYQGDDIEPITEYEIVMGNHLAVKDPFTDRVTVLDESAETRNEDGNWVGTVRLVKSILTPGKLAEKLLRLNAGEEVHFVIRDRFTGYSIRKASVFNTTILLIHRWGGSISIHDDSGIDMNVHDIDMWICDFTGCDPDEHIYEVDYETGIALNHENFNRTHRLRDLRCDEEGWFISDAVGIGYRVEADDERRDLCADDSVALERAKARGIRFHEDKPYCPVELIYPHKTRS